MIKAAIGLKRCLIMLICLGLLFGCGAILPDVPEMDTSAPFEAQAVIEIGAYTYRAALNYIAVGDVELDIVTDKLSRPLRQVATAGSSDLAMGDQQFSYPADWASAANMAQLIRQALVAPKVVTRQEGRLTAEGTALGVPFAMASSEDGKILLSITFPTIGMKTELSDFTRMQ